MKKIKFLFLTFCMGLIVTGCAKTPIQETQYQPELLSGYISINGNILYLDTVEIIKKEDKDRIKELGLIVESDLPNGYYIYNETVESVPFELTDDTTYTFTDFNLLFINEANTTRIYETTKKQEFIEGSSYQDISLEEQKIPYFLSVYDKKVISITEEFIYTQ